ncbi:DNA-3-methyladenine glycosylase family protein [Deinococcus radiomollis]|uniref:DNA-3-methyladenine glycosylase family protein n=1 Tax=Deinococcus radiomollis TaxID=468916 RepID=UPI003892011C
MEGVTTPPDPNLFNLDAAHLHLARDTVMAGLIELHGPLVPLPPAADPFTALVRAVLGQQLSVKAAASIAARLEAATAYVPARLLALAPEALRGLGLSWAKVRTVRAISDAALSGQIDFAHLGTLPDEEVVTALLPLPGIGRWTAEMFLMFSLARPDVFSLGDLGLRRGLEHFYPGQEAATVLGRWSPHRTLAARYLWLARP